MHIFGRKEILHCAACNKELKRHKYRPAEEWKIEGFLCADCHIEKTKEFMLRQVPDTCAMCKKEIADDGKKPRWQWEMEPGSLLCQECYERKGADFNKKLNFCSLCSAKLGLFRYNPKPAWRIEGQFCRQCWDNRNRR